MKILVQVPATSANLGPGFDALGLALTLWNEAVFSDEAGSGEGIAVAAEGEGAGELAQDGSNLIARAARLVFQEAGEPPPALQVRCTNRIPLGAGLGSSAAAILAGMLAANTILGGRFSHDQILQMAVREEGHPDNIAPALLGGLVVSSLDAGRVLARRIELDVNSRSSLCATLVIPDFHFPTREARAALPRQVPLQDAAGNISHALLVAEAFRTGDLDLLAEAMVDKLHQPFRLPLIPGASEAMLAAKHAGAVASALSGAGPGLVAISSRRDPEIGAAMQRAFREAGLGARIFELDVSQQGAQVETIG